MFPIRVLLCINSKAIPTFQLVTIRFVVVFFGMFAGEIISQFLSQIIFKTTQMKTGAFLLDRFIMDLSRGALFRGLGEGI